MMILDVESLRNSKIHGFSIKSLKYIQLILEMGLQNYIINSGI